jgi:hypothetical protein
MRCPKCGDAFYLGKHFSNGIYNNDPAGFDRLEVLYDWMWQHLEKCYEQTEFGLSDIVLFEVVAEGHPKLKFDEEHHWNRHKPGDFKA